jgi:hypothetical protein
LHLLQKVCYWGDYHLEILPLVGFKFLILVKTACLSADRAANIALFYSFQNQNIQLIWRPVLNSRQPTALSLPVRQAGISGSNNASISGRIASYSAI